MKPKHQAFVNAYLGEAAGNAAKAAILAGYSEKAARQIGSRLLTYADVQAAVGRRLEKAEATADRALQNVARLANAEPQRITDAVILKANELILRMEGKLQEREQGSRIQVNIGFLTASQPTIEVTEVMPPRAQVALPGESRE